MGFLISLYGKKVKYKIIQECAVKISKFQSGKFQSIYAHDYQYFLPESIDHNFEIDNGDLQVQLEKSTRLLGELNAMARMVPNINLFIISFINNEATLSSKIEGTQTELDDVFKAEGDISVEKKDDWLEVQLYIDTINESIKKIDKLPISVRLAKQMHKTLLSSGRGKNKMLGEIRTSQNWIGGTNINNASFIPPHQFFVPELMSDLEQFLHKRNSVPDIIKIAIIHYQFETIHPFLDGNGRIGRILIPLYLVNKGLLSKPLLYMSAFFEANKENYYKKLMDVRLKNNFSDWILFFLKGVEQTASHSIETLVAILEMKDNLTQKIHNKPGNRSSNNLRLLDELFKTPFIQVNQVKEKLCVSPTTAKYIVDDLVEIEILQELTHNKRNRLFAFQPYLSLLNKPFPV
ncbi:Fic domain protein, Pden_3305 type [uncultured Gammaproteobacteria bacterium]|jgi:Fic family protein|nr:Fic domain protein, Pden_3305 type [uncultured Gammaproteobacteria bacterium]